MFHIQNPSINTEEQWTIGALINWLAQFGQTEEGGVTRLLYSEVWQQAQQALQQKMTCAGLEAYSDSVGNVFGRITGTNQSNPVILTGSHIDTVVQGGKYDGAYGVLASLLAVQRLIAMYGPPKKTIEVVSLCEEEGSRFPLTYWGSKNIVGEYSLANIAGIVDRDNVSLKEAMEQAGYPLTAYKSPKRNDIAQFVEVHIEQGQILEQQKHHVGIVSHIVGQQRFTITFYGQANHAGTTGMLGRKDAMVCAAKAITLLTALANDEYDPTIRVTVGTIQAKPNVSNVIAGEVSFTVDIRHHEQSVINSFVAEMHKKLQTINELYNVTHSVALFAADEPVQLDQQMRQVTLQLAAKRGLKAMEMVSGAGHDSQVFAQYVPTMLLFVPSRDGISHSPLEFTAIADLERGVNVLQDLLYCLAYEGADDDEL